MGKLTMGSRAGKAAVNNSSEKALGVDLFLDSIEKAEPFASLFAIKPETLEAIKADMKANGFDPSKPVNVWKKPEGSRVLIDGYTRVRAAEELGFMRVTAYEKTFKDEAEALAYAVHTQRNRRNMDDGERLRLIEILDEKKDPGRKSGPRGPESETGRSAARTAEAIGSSESTVKRARVVLTDPVEAEAVKKGAKTINQAEKAIKAKREKRAPEPVKARADYSALRARLAEALADARRACEADKDTPSSPFDAGRYDGLKQALEILDEVAGRRG